MITILTLIIFNSDICLISLQLFYAKMIDSFLSNTGRSLARFRHLETAKDAVEESTSHKVEAVLLPAAAGCQDMDSGGDVDTLTNFSIRMKLVVK